MMIIKHLKREWGLHGLMYYPSAMEGKRAWNSKILFAHSALSNLRGKSSENN